MADTRKDKRAPISLKVRFKSATLDEFIEQYSEDISRGGIFIKSKTPMSVGTLLKFEFQLKDESRLIHGVGRVVWRREAGGSEPPGMGIKFIKMDPESRSLVDEMVQKRGDAPGRFEAGADPKPKKKSGGFFPSTTPESELPAPEDRTQVRHASEFLASALAEGSASSASEAEKKAEEARKRTEEIERKRAEAKKKRKPRIKKTLVGMGIPAVGENDDLAAALDKAKAATEERKKEEVEAKEAKADEAAAEDSKAADAKDEAKADAPADEAKADEAADTKAEEAKADEAADSKAANAKAADAEAADSKDEAKADEAADTKADEAADTKADEAAAAKAADEAKAAEAKAEEPKPEPKPEPKAKPKPIAKAEPKPKPAIEERKAPVAAAAAAEDEESGGGMGLIIFAVVAVVAIGAIVYLQMQPGDEDPAPDPNPTAEVTEPEVEEPVIEEPDVEEPEPEPAVETMAVAVSATPEGVTFTIDGAPAALEDGSLQLPVGQAATIVAHLDGHVDATQEVTAAEGQEALEFALEPMPYVIAVTTVPDNAQVRGGGGSTNGSGEIELSGAPDGAVSLSATARGFQRGTADVEPGAFTEQEGRMVAAVTITLEERAAPSPRPRPRPPANTGDEADPPAGGDTGGDPAPDPEPAPEPEPEPAPEPEPEPEPTAAPENPF